MSTSERAKHPGLGIVGAVVIGAVLAVQSRINGELGTRLDDGVAAALISFGGGLLITGVLAAVLPAGRAGMRELVNAVRSGEIPPVYCLGGVCGGYLVFTQSLTAGVIGVALFTVSVVAGQVVCGLLVDRLGIGPGGPQPVTVPRVVGAALALVAVCVAVSAKLGAPDTTLLVLLPLLAGLGTAWQQAVNGRVKQAADSALVGSALNFTAGSLALGLALAVEIAVRGLPQPPPGEIGLYVGGALGAVVIGGGIVIVRHTGVLLLGMGMVGGQLVGAAALDVVVPAPGTRIEISTLVGIALTLVAVGIASWPSRTPGRSPGLPR